MLAGELETQVRIRTLELEQRNREVTEQSDQLRELSHRLQQTQDEERRHIARELHDSAGQIITAIGINLGNIRQRVPENRPLARSVEDTQALLLQLSKEIRTTSYLLHPPLLDENGLPEAIRWYIDGLAERSGLNIDLITSQDFGRVSGNIEVAVFRIVQECLTNIHRHSGSKRAKIHLAREAERVSLEIQDEGKGIAAEKLAGLQAHQAGVGIAGIRERVRHLGGTMNIESGGGGTRISVTFPIAVFGTAEAVASGNMARRAG